MEGNPKMKSVVGKKEKFKLRPKEEKKWAPSVYHLRARLPSPQVSWELPTPRSLLLSHLPQDYPWASQGMLPWAHTLDIFLIKATRSLHALQSLEVGERIIGSPLLLPPGAKLRKFTALTKSCFQRRVKTDAT